MIKFIGENYKDIAIGLLVLWNFLLLYLCLNCDGCKNEHDVKMAQENEENLFKKYLEKESECECLKETNKSLKIEIQKLEKKCQIKDEIIRKGEQNGKK